MTFSRRNLPHLHYELGSYFSTYRLANSIPQNILREITIENSKIKDEELRFRKTFGEYDNILDLQKHGPNYLLQDNIAETVKRCIRYPDGVEYKLICYTLMPNHVHQVFDLIEGNRGLSKIMQSIKGVSSRESNKQLNRSGRFWQDESFDRLIRNEIEYYRIVNYVMQNPVKAGLVDSWKDWKHSYCHPDFVKFVL